MFAELIKIFKPIAFMTLIIYVSSYIISQTLNDRLKAIATTCSSYTDFPFINIYDLIIEFNHFDIMLWY